VPDVTIHYINTESEDLVVDKVLASTEVFKYWAFWYPKDENGRTRVRFIADSQVEEVNLYGEEEEPKLASVTPLHGGDNIGPVPQG